MKNQDTRIQVTKAMFHQAMLELLEEKAVGFISVKELCERAGVNRGTFYLHYAEPMDVLHEMEDAARATVTDFVTEGMYGSLLESLRAVRKDSRLISVVIGHNGNPEFLRSVRDEAFRNMEAVLQKQYPHSSPEEIRRVFDFVYSGCTGLVTGWLQEETPEPTEQFAKRLSGLIETVFNTLQAE